jgi:two-component sensor histidine kinase
LVLTELVTNAVEHGLKGLEHGEVGVTATRQEGELVVVVHDSGSGLPGGKIGDGLGTQIVKTLVEGELGGTISWTSDSDGTRVEIQIPLRFLHEKEPLQGVPIV